MPCMMVIYIRVFFDKTQLNNPVKNEMRMMFDLILNTVVGVQQGSGPKPPLEIILLCKFILPFYYVYKDSLAYVLVYRKESIITREQKNKLIPIQKITFIYIQIYYIQNNVHFIKQKTQKKSNKKWQQTDY